MIIFFTARKSGALLKVLNLSLAVLFFIASLGGDSYAYLPAQNNKIGQFSLSGRNPFVLRGVRFYPESPLKFDFIIANNKEQVNNAGQKQTTGINTLEKQETEKLIRYFLAALTIPEEDLWVNLSP